MLAFAAVSAAAAEMPPQQATFCEAADKGLRTRRTGTSISVLNANGYEGERRPSNLEDVFVLLTGEEIG